MARAHVPALDGLRAIAVASVIAFHVRPDAAGPSLVAHVWDAIAECGWCGVDLFFVLSGFLITGILLDAKGKPNFFRNFYIRRTLRIFPIYYVVLVGMLLVLPHVLDARDPAIQRVLRHQGALWTYTTNIDYFVTAEHGGFSFNAGWMHLTHLWSLAVEEQFYLVWPLLVFALPRRGLLGVVVGLIVGAPIVRAVMIAAGVSSHAIYEFTPCRIDTLAMGALLAVVVRARPEWCDWLARSLVVVGAVGIIVVLLIVGGADPYAPLMQTAGFTLVAMSFAGVLLSATLPGRVARGLAWRPLVVVGRYTYGIYLFHALLIGFFLARLAPHIPPVGGADQLLLTALVFVTSLVVAVVSYHLFEQRFLKLKGRWT